MDAVKTLPARPSAVVGHNQFFESVMYTTGMLRYALIQFVAHVT
ncbi:UNVERIFIED_ORG: hypothetical protein J2X79_003069 [Arthrobacter globiformis]|nr:hypothetical protein [Arthrobacter globiformis]